jgi:L-seryl-tRNA(Ser) seleniumtransferase
MTKTKSLIALCAIALLVVPMSALQANVAGEWEMTSEGRQGPRTQIFKIEQDGEKITVSTEGRRGEMKGEGTIKGNEIEWTFTMSMGDRGDMTMTYKGKVEGDTMKGEVQMGDFGAREWTAKKK